VNPHLGFLFAQSTKIWFVVLSIAKKLPVFANTMMVQVGPGATPRCPGLNYPQHSRTPETPKPAGPSRRTFQFYFASRAFIEFFSCFPKMTKTPGYAAN
jgi:hypothetical protein